jgi:hypothetical protein
LGPIVAVNFCFFRRELPNIGQLVVANERTSFRITVLETAVENRFADFKRCLRVPKILKPRCSQVTNGATIPLGVTQVDLASSIDYDIFEGKRAELPFKFGIHLYIRTPDQFGGKKKSPHARDVVPF